jgi:hypothetical protein
LLDFEVISAHFTILSIVSIPYLHCDEFAKSFTKLFLRMIMFSKSLFKFDVVKISTLNVFIY